MRFRAQPMDQGQKLVGRLMKLYHVVLEPVGCREECHDGHSSARPLEAPSLNVG